MKQKTQIYTSLFNNVNVFLYSGKYKNTFTDRLCYFKNVTKKFNNKSE